MSSDYDVAIVGAGPVGAILARRLGAAGARVLVLEAGPAAGRTWADYQANVEQYRAAGFKVPNSPYYSPADAPSPNVLDIRKLSPGSLPDDTGYFVQDGPLPFATDYQRSQGGTMLHWLGTCLRMVPADFEAASRYGHGRDWPLGYDELDPWYEKAELELGVAANVEDQQYLGLRYRPGYVYPMYRIPPSYLDQCVARTVDGRTVTLDGERYELQVSSTPQARNSMPNPHYDGGNGYQPVGAHGAPHEGLRCEGNSSCIPICPVQAKYNPLKTWGQVTGAVEVRTQCVVSRLIHSGPGPISALEYIEYEDGQPPPKPQRVTADLFVLAGNAIENAKLLLASRVPNTSDQIGRNLMDHPYVLAWALMPYAVGAFRGPSSTSGIEILRDGAVPLAAGGVPDGDLQLGLGLRGVRPVHGRPDRGRPRAPSGRRCATSSPTGSRASSTSASCSSSCRTRATASTSATPTATRSASRARGSSTTSTTTRAPAWPPPGSCGPSCSTTSGRRTRPSTGRPIPAT